MEGKQFEFDEPTIGIYTNHDNNIIHLNGSSTRAARSINRHSLLQTNGVNRVRATLMRHIGGSTGWKCLFRFHDEVYPRQREVIFIFIEYCDL